ncbi:hypothetical protein [Bacillus sp. FJAT-47783]|uniref:hypothetical protein n=1 Tax=Bacillus sp. FJAT-47783 TaxID=2922712 RepID=UPI001FAB5C73|nr:hypothetical protein [Bacillus sp. FJAT-47783]
MNKEIMKYIVYFAAATIVIGGLVIGKIQEKQTAMQQPKEQAEQEKKDDLALTKESDPAPSEEEKKEDDHEHHDESMDEIGEFDLSELDESEKNYTIDDRPSLSDYYRPEEITATKEVGEKFVRSFHPFDGKHPTKHIEESKPYISDELHQKMTGEEETIIRPTKNFFTRKVISVEMREPRDVTGEYITWEARVIAEIHDENGNKVREDLTVYTLRFQNVEGVYRVQDFMTNAIS